MIVTIGDSITFGQHVPFGRAWPYLLTGDMVISVGVSGDTTRLGLERFPKEVQAHAPAKVVIQFGHNDCNRWETDRGLTRVSRPAYRWNLIEMIDRCRAFGSLPYLCTLTPSFRSEQHAGDVAKYDATLRQVAEVENVPLIDVRAAFDGMEGLLMADGLHLTEEGHKVYAKVVQEALDQS